MFMGLYLSVRGYGSVTTIFYYVHREKARGNSLAFSTY